MSQEIRIVATPVGTKDKPPKVHGTKCLECLGGLEAEYGHCKFGLGLFDRCSKCFRVYNFTADTGE